MKQSFLLLLLFFSASTIYAQTASKSGSFSDLAFIEGHWKASSEGRTIEAFWLAPAADNMTGCMRMIKEGKVIMYEILAYEQSDKGLISLVKHFQPGLIGQEEKDAPVTYHFVEQAKPGLPSFYQC
jgi:hypothetical protein